MTHSGFVGWIIFLVAGERGFFAVGKKRDLDLQKHQILTIFRQASWGIYLEVGA
jgi:hypothetical protein